MSKPAIVITGGAGQLGVTLLAAWQRSALSADYAAHALDKSALDISDAEAVNQVLDSLAPVLVINAAAYTAVDKAETEPERAHAINAAGVAKLASWVAKRGAKLVHVSTDFVFDGAPQTRKPFGESSATCPLGVYGVSKLAGEQAIATIAPEHSVVVRTSWLYSEHGGNFVKTMLHLMAERDALSIVNDQLGSPTSTHTLAAVLVTAAARLLDGDAVAGLYQWSDGGEVSWYDFACEIQIQAVALGILDRAIPLTAIPTSAYPTPAGRPAYSVMSRERAQATFACPQRSWQQELGEVLASLRTHQTHKEL